MPARFAGEHPVIEPDAAVAVEIGSGRAQGPAPTTLRRDMRARPILRAAKVAAPTVVAFFVGRIIYHNWQQVREAEWTLDAAFLLGSFLCAGCWYLIRPWTWGMLLAHFGHPLSYRESFLVVRQAELSRYVPGAIWQYLSRVYLAGRQGVPAAATLAATMVDTVILLMASTLPALWYLTETLPELGSHQRVFLVVIPVLACVALHPKLINLWAAFLSKKLKQPYTELKIRWPALAGIWGLYLLTWVIHGLGVALFVRAVLAIPLEWIPRLASHYALGWLVGMVSMIAPAGLGVRDGTFGLLASSLMPIGAAMTVAVGVRLWLTLTELFWTLGGRWVFQPRGG